MERPLTNKQMMDLLAKQEQEDMTPAERRAVRSMPTPDSKPSAKQIAAKKQEKQKDYAANRQRVIRHLQKRGLSNAAIAGIVGNIDVETGGSFDHTLRQTVSGKASDPRTIESGGYGLFQFDDYAKNTGHESWYKGYLKDKGKKDSPEAQLDYLLDMVMAGADKQDPNFKYAKKMGETNASTLKAYLTTNTNPSQIADAITDRFEKPGSPHSARRRASAQETFEELAPRDRADMDMDAQYINQSGEIRDTDTDVPIVDVPDKKSTYEKIKPYIPILRHFNEGGMSTDYTDIMRNYPITEEMIETMENMTPEERAEFRRKIVSEAIEGIRDGEQRTEPMSKKGKDSIKKLRRYYNDGGIAKQMELFEDGGLMDEGGTTDPISGNDVPPGSTQEEVRDDIPAQLSEGEFVFPADVVRYIGLEKLMQMRQEAKMGLRMMEDMGQMGNSDEAVMPDDIPFDLSDLDMDDDLEYNVGGFVPGQSNPFGIAGTQQSAFAGGVGGYTPYQMPQYGQTPMAQAYTPAQQQFVPTQPVPTTLPTPEQFLPNTPTDPEVTTKEYINPETGEKRVITFVGGQPTIAIPPGFITMEEYEKTQPPATETPVTTTPTTRVVERDDSGDERRRAEEIRQFGETGARLGVGKTSYGISYDTESGIMPGIMGAIGIGTQAFTGNLPKNTIVNFKSFDDEFSVTGDQYNDLKNIIKEHGATSDTASNFLDSLKNNFNENVKEIASSYGVDAKANTKEILKQASEESGHSNDDLIRGAQIRRELEKHNQEVQQKAAAKRAAQQVPQVSDEGDMGPVYTPGSDSDSGGSQPSGGGRTGSSSTDWSQPDSSASVGSQSDYDKMYGNQGGLASKPKPKAKKMKQGGIASKK